MTMVPSLDAPPNPVHRALSDGNSDADTALAA
jgi:hypothetical protein